MYTPGRFISMYDTIHYKLKKKIKIKKKKKKKEKEEVWNC